MIERRRNTQVLSAQDEARQQMRELRIQERDIESQLRKDKPVVDGEIDYSEYDQLMAELREVRAEMVSLARFV